MASVEEKVEEQYKRELDEMGVRYYGKTENINDAIKTAFDNSKSKSGGNGRNYPDIKLLLDNNYGRYIPVVIEAKGKKGKLEKLTKEGAIEQVTFWASDSKEGAKNPHKKGDENYSTIENYAVNGALHYGNAILNEGTYNEVIIVGINGTKTDAKTGTVLDFESKAYYVAKKNNSIPKHIAQLEENVSLFKDINRLFDIVDSLGLTDAEREILASKTEAELDEKISSIHNSIHQNEIFSEHIGTNDKLYLFCGLIMAGLKAEGIYPLEVSDLKGNRSEVNNDGTIIINNINSFLQAKKCSQEKIEMIISLLSPIFKNKVLWTPVNGISPINGLFKQIKADIIPILESELHLDFTGKILNRLSDWVHIDNDDKKDVVLTPRHVTKLMARLARTNKDSFVWDKAMGSAGFLVSAMDIMIKDAKEQIKNEKELEEKIKNIKEKQLLGMEILGNIYILAVLNMMLMGDGASNVLNGDSHELTLDREKFPANVFLLNPPYSAPGKGLIFVEEALSQMINGYAAILIQDSAGSGQGNPYAKRILENNTLVASIKMPKNLFMGKAGVHVHIFLFEVGKPHDEDTIVKFIDFSNDGYFRQNRKNSNQEVNLKNVDHALERYEEIVAIVLGKKPKTNFYTKENGCIIEDTIALSGEDWLFTAHQESGKISTSNEFKDTVSNHLSSKLSRIIRGI